MSVIKIDGVVLVETDKLIPNPDNTNDHPKDQIDHLAKQYAYTGMRTPIIVSKQSGLIVAGHGRWLAAKKAKLKHVPVSYQDFETPAQEFAFSVADNATADWANLNLGKINLQLPQFGPELKIEMLGIKDFQLDPAEKIQPEIDINFDYKIEISCKNESFQKELYEEMIGRGLEVRILL